MATCFSPICIMWPPPDSVPDEPPPSHIFFIGFPVGNVAQNHWLDGEQPATVLLYDADPDVPVIMERVVVKGDELLTSENPEFANSSGMVSLVGVPYFYLASVVQVIHTKAVAMAYGTTNDDRNVAVMVVEIPFLWFCPPQVQQNQEEDDENEDEDEDVDGSEDSDNESMDEVVSYSLEDGMYVDVDVDVDVAVPATKASIEALEKFKLEGLNSMDKCTICLEQLSREAKVSRMPCSHVFHPDCIIDWLNKSHMCPLCRFKMPVDPS